MKDIFQSKFFVKLSGLYTALSDKIEGFSASGRKIPKKLVIIGFAVIIAALAAFSAIILIDENSASPEAETTAMDEIDPALLDQGNKSLKGRFALIFTDTEKTKVMSVMEVEFDSSAAAFRYSIVPHIALVDAGGTLHNFSDHYAEGGTNQLMLAVSAYTGNEYDRYIIADETSLIRLFELAGEMTTVIPTPVSYEHNGVSFIIDEGTHTLTADTLLKYYLYLISEPDKNGDIIAGIILNCLEKVVSYEDDAQLENSFCTALGYFDTNITAHDFSSNKELIRAIPSLGLVPQKKAD